MPRKLVKDRKYHFIYKTTCNVTGKYYIGMHSTDNLEDGYLGSGKRLRYSVRKYGPENHSREILEFCKSREELIIKETEIVNLNEIAKEECMNLVIGGTGGWTIDQQKENAKKSNIRQKWLRENDIDWSIAYNKKLSIALYNQYANGTREYCFQGNFDWTGKKHSEETKKKMSESQQGKQKGKRNSQHGTMWITNGKENKKIKKDIKIPLGWSKGRKIKHGV